MSEHNDQAGLHADSNRDVASELPLEGPLAAAVSAVRRELPPPASHARALARARDVLVGMPISRRKAWTRFAWPGGLVAACAAILLVVWGVLAEQARRAELALAGAPSVSRVDKRPKRGNTQDLQSLPSPYYMGDDVGYLPPSLAPAAGGELIPTGPAVDAEGAAPAAVAYSADGRTLTSSVVSNRVLKKEQNPTHWASVVETREDLFESALARTDTHDHGAVVHDESRVQLQEAESVVAEQEWDREAYARIVDNPFLSALDNPLSTFSTDVDTASYANVRRFLTQGQLPPPDAVRIEELVNYFPYDYSPPADETPFAVHTEVAGCPWAPEHRLVRVGLKGRVIAQDQRKASNLVFLLDVSGSMDEPAKLPLVKSAMKLLVDQLGENDRVAMAVYAGASGLVLDSTTGDRKPQIVAALDQLQAGGSTNGGQGIELAYRVALDHFITGGVNRVILCTDGDFNVGVTSDGDLTRLIEEKAKTGVFLSVLGFGDGNLQDAKMEALADRGNGNYGYCDNLAEARKLFVEQMTGTLVTIAKDVKIQIEFNPAAVAAYRLIGYENRLLRAEDFTDDTKDAGEIGAGHTVTALYEVVPAGKPAPVAAGNVPPLKYQRPAELTAAAEAGETLTLRLRYKQPDGNESSPLEFTVKDDGRPYGQATVDFKFAAAVASFGMLLRDSPYRGNAAWDGVLELAEEGLGHDPSGYRAEFLTLVHQAKALRP